MSEKDRKAFFWMGLGIIGVIITSIIGGPVGSAIGWIGFGIWLAIRGPELFGN